MKILVMTGALVAGVLAWQPAIAQSGPKAPVYRYCLVEGGGLFGGGGGELCRYNTLAQCWASKTGPTDLCYLNPRYPGSKR